MKIFHHLLVLITLEEPPFYEKTILYFHLTLYIADTSKKILFYIYY